MSMSIEQLTQNESIVILALMRNPEHSDTEISKAIGMNLFTFNKVKNSLIKRRFLSKYYVPNYGRLGLEILVVSHGSSMDSFNRDRGVENIEMVSDDGALSIPIFSILEGNNGVSFHILSDFTNLKRMMRLKGNLMDSMDIPVRSIHHSLFSLKDLKIERFFDVQGLLEERVGACDIPKLDAETPGQFAAFRDWSDFFDMADGPEEDILDEGSFRVLKEIVRRPEFKETDLIKEMGISRYRFRKTKDRLLEIGYIKPFYGTNVVGMGYEVLIFTHMRFKPGLDPRELFRLYEDQMPNNLMIIAFDHTEVVGLGIFKNLSEGSRAQMNMRNAIMDHGFLEGEPEIKIFSLPNCVDGPPLSFHSPLYNGGIVSDPMKINGVVK